MLLELLICRSYYWQKEVFPLQYGWTLEEELPQVSCGEEERTIGKYDLLVFRNMLSGKWP